MRPVAFSPDGQRFVAVDGAGAIVVRSRDGESLLSVEAPPSGQWMKPSVLSARWSPDGNLIATLENYVLRLRSANDLSIVAEAKDVPNGSIAFVDGGKLVVIADREISLREVPSLEERAKHMLERRPLPDFWVRAIASDPSSSSFVTCDDGGRASDEDDRTTDRDPPQATFFDFHAGAIRQIAIGDEHVLGDDVQFDRFRRRVYTVSYKEGVSTWSIDGGLVGRWKPYASRADRGYIPHAEHLAVSEPWLVTMPSMSAATRRTIDLWEPTSFAHLASAPLPEGNQPYFIAASPDGSRLVTPTEYAGHRGEHGLRIWRVNA